MVWNLSLGDILLAIVLAAIILTIGAAFVRSRRRERAAASAVQSDSVKYAETKPMDSLHVRPYAKIEIEWWPANASRDAYVPQHSAFDHGRLTLDFTPPSPRPLRFLRLDNRDMRRSSAVVLAYCKPDDAGDWWLVDQAVLSEEHSYDLARLLDRYVMPLKLIVDDEGRVALDRPLQAEVDELLRLHHGT